jgi:hypothetical protein
VHGANRSAGYVGLASILFIGNSLADHLDLAAYDITAAPSPGPVVEFQPIESLPPVPFQLPFDWGMDPFEDVSWQNLLHKLRPLVDRALAASDFPYARAVFRDWQRWHDDQETHASWGDAITGARAARLAYLLHATGSRDRALVESAAQHVEKLRDPDLLSVTNHGIAQLHGLAALCLDRTLSSCRGVETLLERRLRILLRHQFARSGVHRENSPAYHFYAHGQLSDMSPILGKYDPELTETLRRAEKQKKWLVHPDLTTVSLGDSAPTFRSDVKIPLGDPDCEDVLFYTYDPSCYFLRRFEEVGYIVVRSDWAIPAEDASMLFVQGGFFNNTHRHADDFSFEWFERGRKILSDSGKYGYTGDKWEYFGSTRAHNTVEVDGSDHSKHPDDAYGDATEMAKTTNGGMRVLLQVHHGDLGFWHRRQIDYRPGEELRIKDTVRSDRVRDYIQWHHFAQAFELSGDAGRFEIDDGEVLVELTTSTSCGDETEYMMIKG